MDMTEKENMMEDKTEVEQEEYGTSIELLIKEDGSMTVSMEDEGMDASEDEDAEKETPVNNIEEALILIKKLAEGVTNDSKMGYDEQENAAYEKEMSGDMA